VPLRFVEGRHDTVYVTLVRWIGLTVQISVVINTYNRAESLALTLDGLSRVDHEDFEVVVVNGPSTDDTAVLLEQWRGRIKIGECHDRNLSASRNIGIALASGDLVAFIDDDAYPDPAWLNDLEVAFDDEEVAAAGGPTLDYTGSVFQARYSVANRLGEASAAWKENPTAVLNSPDADLFPYTIGTNSMFRRERLVEIGGFDEEYEYYLDETDVCRRLVDAGWVVSARDKGFVYHKFLASGLRDSRRVLRDHFAVLKNHLYFGIRHAQPLVGTGPVLSSFERFCNHWRADTAFHIESGALGEEARAKLEGDIFHARERGLQLLATTSTRVRPKEWFEVGGDPFRVFPTKRPAGRRMHLVFVVQDYPPALVDGIGRYVHTLAVAVARQGHVVRVLTEGRHHDTVDLEDGVWVHRVVPREHARPASGKMPPQPEADWNYSASIFAEAIRVHAIRPIDLVQVPNWDSEGAAFFADGSFLTVLSVLTPIAVAGAINPELFDAGGEDFKSRVDLERWCYRQADGFVTPSTGVVKSIADHYGVSLRESRTRVIPLGLPPSTISSIEPPTGRKVLFVGRLERRKGIDVMLEALPLLAVRFPDATFVFVGDDTIPDCNGRPFRTWWEESEAGKQLAHRVAFTGKVSDDELTRHYASCDLFVAPSRYESFGLVLLEAMRCGRPVVGCDCSGMREVIVDGETGFVVPSGDVVALTSAVTTLLSDPDLRVRFGAAGLRRFHSTFTAERMAQGYLNFYNEWVSA
jgi:glycogen synthase